MRIIIFSTNYLPHIGGAELAAKAITDRLEAHDFTLITARLERDRPRREQVGNVQVRRIGFGHRIDVFLLAAFGWLPALLKHMQEGFDLAWAIMASQGGIAGGIFAWMTRLPFVLTLQEGDKEDHLKRYVGGSDLLYKILIRPLHYLPFRVADHITAISEHLKKRARSVVSDTPITIIPNGVDVDRFVRDFAADQLQEIRRQYAGPDDVLVVSTSRLAEKNGLDDLIRATAKLPEKYKLLVLGEGPQRDQLEALIDELDVMDRVFLPGRVEYEAVPRHLQAADIFARPSLSEGMGSSFIEAMAAGLPVVATPVGGITDFLEHEKTGLLAHPEDPESIAKQIRRLDEESDLSEKVTANAQQLIAKKYDWNHIANAYNDIFAKTR